jgi:hypothetical protein
MTAELEREGGILTGGWGLTVDGVPGIGRRTLVRSGPRVKWGTGGGERLIVPSDGLFAILQSYWAMHFGDLFQPMELELGSYPP